MTLTVIGGVLIAFAILSFLFFPLRLMQAVVFFSSFSCTAVINFPNYGMQPPVLLLPIYLARKIVSGDFLRPIRANRDFLLVVLPLAVFAILSIVSLLINQALRSVVTFQVTQTAYALFGIIVTLTLSIEFLNRNRLEAAIRALRAGAVFISLWGIVQVICFYAHIPYPNLFNNSNSHAADMFNQHGNGIIRIASVALEPSFMAVSLMIFGSFGATLLVTEPRFRTRAWRISTGIAILVVAASTSTTGYLGIAVLALLLAVRRPGLVLVTGAIAILASSLVLALLPSFANVVYEVTLGKTATGSYIDRSNTVWHALHLMEQQQPWIGWGWGGVESDSIVTQLLTATGGIGTICFFGAVMATLFASRTARKASRDWKLRAYARGAENAMIVFMAEAVVSSFHFNVADFWCMWAMAIAIPSVMHQSNLAVHPISSVVLRRSQMI
jgi:hypothetical protein